MTLFARVAVAACAAATTMAGAAPAAQHGRPAARAHVVDIREFRYEPSRLIVATGDTIRWINHDPVPHTATAMDSTWDSGRIDAGGMWALVVTDGTASRYLCTYHPSMTASLERR